MTLVPDQLPAYLERRRAVTLERAFGQWMQGKPLPLNTPEEMATVEQLVAEIDREGDQLLTSPKYVAGLFDSGGYVAVRSARGPDGELDGKYLVVTLINRDSGVLEDIRQHHSYDGWVFSNSDGTSTLEFARGTAARFLIDVLPYLNTMRTVARLGLRLELLPLGSGQSPIRTELIQQIYEDNQRRSPDG